MRRLPDETRRAPAKPPAQPVGMAESDMNKSSWQKPASLHTGGCDEKYRVRLIGELMPPDWRALVAERGWKHRFDDPIPLPRGRQIVTLEDADART